MNKTEKAEIIENLVGLIKDSAGIFLVDYQGVNVADITDLRREFIKAEVNYKVFKNTLLKRAFDEVGGFDEFSSQLKGMTGVIFAGENYVAPGKIIKKYFDKNKKFSFKGCYIESQFYGSDKLSTLASMPTKDEIMSGIVGSIAAPASGIVGAISAVMRDVVSLVDEISKKKAA